MSYFSPYYHPLFLPYIDVLAKWWFSILLFLLFPLQFINYKEELSLLHLFVYSLICVYQYGPMEIHTHILWLMINCYCYLFYSWNCSRFGHRELPQIVSFVVLARLYHSLSTSLFSDTIRSFRLILYFPALAL